MPSKAGGHKSTPRKRTPAEQAKAEKQAKAYGEGETKRREAKALVSRLKMGRDTVTNPGSAGRKVRPILKVDAYGKGAKIGSQKPLQFDTRAPSASTMRKTPHTRGTAIEKLKRAANSAYKAEQERKEKVQAYAAKKKKKITGA